MNTKTKKPVKKSSFSTKTNEFNELSTTALLARKSVPLSHKTIANNYVLIKRIYKFQAIKSSITQGEIALLLKYNIKPLADTTIEQVNDELKMMRNLSLSENIQTKKDSDELIAIRAKELKFIVASRYTSFHGEIENGYIALERYFEEISKYYS